MVAVFFQDRILGGFDVLPGELLKLIGLTGFRQGGNGADFMAEVMPFFLKGGVNSGIFIHPGAEAGHLDLQNAFPMGRVMALLLLEQRAEDVEVDQRRQHQQKHECGKLLGALGDVGRYGGGGGQQHIEDQRDACEGIPAPGDPALQLQIQGAQIPEDQKRYQRTQDQPGNYREQIGISQEKVQNRGQINDLHHDGVGKAEGKEEPTVPIPGKEPEEDQAGEAAGHKKQGAHDIGPQNGKQREICDHQGPHQTKGEEHGLPLGITGLKEDHKQYKAEHGRVHGGQITDKGHLLPSSLNQKLDQMLLSSRLARRLRYSLCPLLNTSISLSTAWM